MLSDCALVASGGGLTRSPPALLFECLYCLWSGGSSVPLSPILFIESDNLLYIARRDFPSVARDSPPVPPHLVFPSSSPFPQPPSFRTVNLIEGKNPSWWGTARHYSAGDPALRSVARWILRRPSLVWGPNFPKPDGTPFFCLLVPKIAGRVSFPVFSVLVVFLTPFFKTAGEFFCFSCFLPVFSFFLLFSVSLVFFFSDFFPYLVFTVSLLKIAGALLNINPEVFTIFFQTRPKFMKRTLALAALTTGSPAPVVSAKQKHFRSF